MIKGRPDSRSESARVLVAEDNPSVREYVVRALASAGYEVASAIDGQQALAMILRERFDVLVTDIVMPNVDGIALAMSATRHHPGLRVIMVSGYAQERLRAHNLESLIYKVLAKPFSLEEICDAVKNALLSPTSET